MVYTRIVGRVLDSGGVRVKLIYEHLHLLYPCLSERPYAVTNSRNATRSPEWTLLCPDMCTYILYT